MSTPHPSIDAKASPYFVNQMVHKLGLHRGQSLTNQ